MTLPSSGDTRPHSLRTEYSHNPLGLGSSSPRLSWKLSSGKNIEQRAYQIRAASSSTGLEQTPDLFDTGKQSGKDSVFVAWPGEGLVSRQQVCWQVRVWLRGQKIPTVWSEVASFETGLLTAADWRARWIAFGDDGKNASPPAPYLRKNFILPSPPVQARLYASALGLFDFEINGKAVHPGEVFLPGWTDFRKRTQVMTFDVTKLLRSGENIIGSILGDGWYAGTLGFTRGRQTYGGSPALLAQLEVRLADGRLLRIVSDRNWSGRTGPILASDIYDGETYDARMELPQWSVPGSSSKGWHPVRVEKKPKLILDAKVSPPVARIETIKARRMSEPSPEVFIFDLGQNMTGWARLRLQGKSGQTVTLRFGEMLNSDGSLYTTNLRSAKVTDSYTFGRDEAVDWEPRFTFHGFRYVELTGAKTRPAKSAITGVVLHNAMEATGSFTCSNPLVNQLESNIRWGLKSNFLEVPTDCPQRDERLGWTGDIQVFAKTASFLYDVDGFLTKWMRDMRDSQRADGAFPDVAPTFVCGFGNAAWADAGVIVPWVIYRRFGDQRILKENYAAMTAWIDFQERTSRDLIRPNTAYGDWLAIDAVSPERAPVPCDLIGTAYFSRTCGIMAEVADVLKRTDDRRRFLKLQSGVRTAFQRQFVTPGGRVIGDCQTAYLLALAFDLFPMAMRKAAVERLVELILTRGLHLTTGFVGTPLLCPVLSRFGKHDVAMKLLLQESYPSWLFTVKNGATTMWERWNSYTPDRGFGDANMNSFNHYAYGAVGEWMVHFVAGIAPGPDAPAYGHIIFRPRPCEGLTSVQAKLETPYGEAQISWEMGRSKMSGRLVIPPNTFADFEPHAPCDLTMNGKNSFPREIKNEMLDCCRESTNFDNISREKQTAFWGFQDFFQSSIIALITPFSGSVQRGKSSTTFAKCAR